MKISKSHLKRLIKEEVEQQRPQEAKMLAVSAVEEFREAGSKALNMLVKLIGDGQSPGELQKQMKLEKNPNEIESTVDMAQKAIDMVAAINRVDSIYKNDHSSPSFDFSGQVRDLKKALGKTLIGE
tara:strand:- start:100 stop:477 length:378 start_codon:yes stop_codon:yes gene_type:complete